MVTTGRRYTLADLLDWSADDDDNIYDLLAGELVMRNVPDVNHGLLLMELILFLGAAQQGGHGYLLTSTTAVALDFPARGEDAEDVPHPDLLYVSAERLALLGCQVVEGVPDLVVEILSPGTAGDHEQGGRLRDAYARHGVPHYWLADPAGRSIRLYRLAGQPYVGGAYDDPITLRPGDTLTFPLPPGHALPVAQLFRGVRDWPRRRRRRGDAPEGGAREPGR